MANAELEVVTYRIEEMLHASRELINNYAQYSGIPGTELWPRMIFRVSDIIKNQLQTPCEWTSPGLSMRFSGFMPTGQRENEEGKLQFSADEPMFTLQEGWPHYLRPAIITHISRVTGAIVEEMQNVYKLNAISDGASHYLKFSKDKYAKSIDVVTVPLFETG